MHREIFFINMENWKYTDYISTMFVTVQYLEWNVCFTLSRFKNIFSVLVINILECFASHNIKNVIFHGTEKKCYKHGTI